MVDRKETKMDTKYEAFQRLNEIFEQMDALISEVDYLTRHEFPEDYPNASSYWIAHIKSALGNYGYHTYSTTFHSFLESLEEEFDDEETSAELMYFR